MDLNGDGCIDILSGSYSRQDKDMAGLFQVLWGKKDGTFKKVEVLKGSDGEPLILPGSEGEDVDLDKICTRPYAADLDGDGKLDIVSGNFRGTFGFFQGEGNGKFAPKATWLEAGGKPVEVPMHSDPFLVDWDGDGDLDLLSGSAEGGAFLFCNEGTKTAPKFDKKTTLVKAAGHGQASGDQLQLGDAHCVAPAADTRVWASDVNGDGKLDLLIGDMVSLCFLAKGVSEETARTKLASLNEQQEKLFEANQGSEKPDATARREMQAAAKKLHEERKKIVTDEMTGFVWLLLQK